MVKNKWALLALFLVLVVAVVGCDMVDTTEETEKTEQTEVQFFVSNNWRTSYPHWIFDASLEGSAINGSVVMDEIELEEAFSSFEATISFENADIGNDFSLKLAIGLQITDSADINDLADYEEDIMEHVSVTAEGGILAASDTSSTDFTLTPNETSVTITVDQSALYTLGDTGGENYPLFDHYWDEVYLVGEFNNWSPFDSDYHFSKTAEGFEFTLSETAGSSVLFKIMRDMDSLGDRYKGTDFGYMRDMRVFDNKTTDIFRPSDLTFEDDGFQGYNARVTFPSE